VPKAKLDDTIKDIVLSDRTLGITLVSSRQDAGNNAWIDLRSGQHDDAGNLGARSRSICVRCVAHMTCRRKGLENMAPASPPYGPADHARGYLPR